MGIYEEIDGLPHDDPRWMSLLTETVDHLEQQAPVARRAADPAPGSAPPGPGLSGSGLRADLVRLAAIASTWAEKLGTACDHYGFVRSFRNRAIGGGSGAFEIRERVMCTRCGESFGDHTGRP
ncbi:hypothetical protein [Microlunatus soli]|uniref:Uncharacterized protein n=1 Tax=Microlunatus soli TaxID=630515 RepID=A0A1H1ZJI2_9ACTN|nr:hypothetical protein [Microlunatus soli]SDT33727.1 hypothetical protein SAMN04489812_5257 [Microlunatus soli]